MPDRDITTTDSPTGLKGVDIGLSGDDPLVDTVAKLELKYPGHLVLIQAGLFLHGYNRTAYVLHVLKKYKLKLCALNSTPYLRVGFPIGNFKRRLWNLVDEFGIPYVVALGSQQAGYTVYTGNSFTTNSHVLDGVSDDIVGQVINDLRQFAALNTAGAKKLLAEPDTVQFQLKSQAIALDSILTSDLVALPRDVRAIWGENVRQCMHRIMLSVFQYGNELNKLELLHRISADVDLLKHYIAQAQKLKNVRFSFEHRASLIVELGRLVGGLIRSNKHHP